MAKKKGKKAKEPVDPAVAAAEARRQELIKEAAFLKEGVDKQTLEAHRFKLSKAKLQMHWAVAKKQTDDCQSDLRRVEQEIDDVRDVQAIEITTQKQKLKHLLLELHSGVTTTKISGEVEHKQKQDLQATIASSLRVDQRHLKRASKEAELMGSNAVVDIRSTHDRNMYEMRHEYERKIMDAKNDFEKKSRGARDEAEVLRKSQVSRLEKRKMEHSQRLISEHEKALKEIREYYVDITHNNLEKIKDFKTQVGELRGKEEQDELAIRRVARENARMTTPLQRATEEAYRLSGALRTHLAEKEALRVVKAKLLIVQENEKNAEWEAEVLRQKLGHLTSDNDRLTDNYRTAQAEADRRASFNRLLIEKKTKAANDAAKMRESQLQACLTHVGQLGANSISQVTAEANPLEVKRAECAELQTELDDVNDLYIKLVETVRSKLNDFGVAPAEIGFEPLETLKPMELTMRMQEEA